MKPGIELVRLIAVILITFTHTRNNLESGLVHFIIEKLPTYGTAILSIISGYLYYTVSRKKPGLLSKKIKSLAIPYLIANACILGLVLLFNYGFGYNPLNRLTYDWSLIIEGLFSLSSPPINPPTYFIRDIFVTFAVIALFAQKEWKALLIILPFLFFGHLILRWDVVFLFAIGVGYALIEGRIKKTILIGILSLALVLTFLFVSNYLKFPLAVLIFLMTVDLNFKFMNTGRYSYLLHLYHSPIMVISFPIIDRVIVNPTLKIVTQIVWAIVMVYILFLASKRISFLRILSGGR